jgi:plasmid stability protein
MATITVKNIPDDLYEQLKRNARANHRSINSEIIACIERSVGSRALNVTTFLADARRLREMTAFHVLTDDELEAAKEEGRP